jgi:hypothetical protein
MVFLQGMTFVVLAVRAVLPADLPVLFGVLYNRFAGAQHDGQGEWQKIIDLVILISGFARK